jgi:hypothetical protein
MNELNKSNNALTVWMDVSHETQDRTHPLLALLCGLLAFTSLQLYFYFFVSLSFLLPSHPPSFQAPPSPASRSISQNELSNNQQKQKQQ